MVELLVVDAALVRASVQAVERVRGMLADLGIAGTVVPFGSSGHEGCLSRGDIDVLLRLPPGSLGVVLADLRGVFEVAQPENWTDDFASFRGSVGIGTDRVGIQVVQKGSAVDLRLRGQVAALEDAPTRAAYDRAKRHGATLGPQGYWQVKDLFWRSRGAEGPTWDDAAEPVCKVLTAAQWQELCTVGWIAGAPVDVADGYVHLSTPEQVDETVARHFVGQTDLWLLTLDAGDHADRLRWETSRGGQAFPHLYAPLRLADVRLARPWR